MPADAAQDSEPQKHPVAGLEAGDPRTEVIERGYQVRDIDRQVNALVDQQIDIEGAQGQQLGQRLRQAQSKGTQEELALVMADARVYVSGVRRFETIT